MSKDLKKQTGPIPSCMSCFIFLCILFLHKRIASSKSPSFQIAWELHDRQVALMLLEDMERQNQR